MLGIFTLLSFTLNSCEYFVDVAFDVATMPHDTLIVQRWGPDNSIDTIPYTNSPGTSWQHTVNSIHVSMPSAMGGPFTTIPEESAFATLIHDIDSIKIIRKSDGAFTITYRHDDNATEAQRYFFTRVAWDCDPPCEELKKRTYTFILTDDMFH